MSTAMNGIMAPVLTKYLQIRNPGPSDCFVFIDENEGSIEDGHFGYWLYPATRWLNMPSDRHGRKTTLSYADGHVSVMRWMKSRAFRYPDQPVADAQDLEDLRQLQAAIPNP